MKKQLFLVTMSLLSITAGALCATTSPKDILQKEVHRQVKQSLSDVWANSMRYAQSYNIDMDADEAAGKQFFTIVREMSTKPNSAAIAKELFKEAVNAITNDIVEMSAETENIPTELNVDATLDTIKIAVTYPAPLTTNKMDIDQDESLEDEWVDSNLR